MFGNILNQLTGGNHPQQQGQQPPEGGEHPPQQPQGGNDFLSGLMNAAQEVGRAIGEKTQEGAGAVKSGASTVADTTKSTAEGAGRLTKEEMEKLASGISDLVGKAAGAFSKNKEGPVEVEEQITAVDSQGGKVQISSTSDGSTAATTVSQEKPKEGGDFFSGLLDAAKQVGQAIGEKTQEGAGAVKSGAQNVAETTKSTAEGAAKVTKEDIDKITAGIGDLIGKAAGALHIGEKKESPKPEEKKEEPVIDDVEGEISKVVTAGYTADKPVTPTEGEKEGFFSSAVSKTQEMTSGAIETVKSGAGSVSGTVKEGASSFAQGTQDFGETLKDKAVAAGETVRECAASGMERLKEGASGAYEKTKEGAGSVVEGAQELGERVKERVGDAGEAVRDAASSGIEMVKEGATTGYEKTRDLAQSAVDSVQSGGEAAVEGTKTFGGMVKDGAAAVIEGAQDLGVAVKDKTTSVAEAAVDKAKQLGGAVEEGARDLGHGVFDAVSQVKEDLDEVIEGADKETDTIHHSVDEAFVKAQEFGGSVREEHHSVVDSPRDKASFAIGASAGESVPRGPDATAQGMESNEDLPPEPATPEGDMLRDTARSVVTAMQELIEAVQDRAQTAVEVVRKSSHDLAEAVEKIPLVDEEGTKEITGDLQEEKAEKAETTGTSSEARESTNKLSDYYKDFDQHAAEAVQLPERRGRLERRVSEMSDWEEEIIKEGNLEDEDSGEAADLLHVLMDVVRSGAENVEHYLHETVTSRWHTPPATERRDSGAGIFYESALGVGTAFLEGAATIVEAVRGGTEAVVEGVIDGANRVSEEAMYGPDPRERRSQSPSPQVARETKSVPKTVPSLEEKLRTPVLEQLSQRSESALPLKEEASRQKVDSESESHDFVVVARSRKESQMSDSSWTELEMRERIGSASAKHRPIVRIPTPDFEVSDSDEELMPAAPPTATHSPVRAALSRPMVEPNTLVDVNIERKPAECEASVTYCPRQYDEE